VCSQSFFAASDLSKEESGKNIWVCPDFTALATCHKDETLQEKFIFKILFDVSNALYGRGKKGQEVFLAS